MKKYPTILLLLLCLSALSRLDAGCRTDSMYTFIFNDSNGLKEKTGVTHYSYDANGFLTEEMNSYLDSGQWFKYYKITYSNNSQGKHSGHLYQLWDQVDNKWVNAQQAVYTYDSNDLLIESAFQVWDLDKFLWVNEHKIQQTYNSVRQETLYLAMIWNNKQWENVAKVDYKYDGSGLKISFISSHWDGSNWNATYSSTFTYTAGKETEQLVKEWQSGNWVNSIKQLRTYTSGKLRSLLRQDWSNDKWVNTSQEVYAFDDINCTFKTDFYSSWNVNSSRWDYHLQDSSFSKKTTDIHTVNKEYIKVYPNPTHGELSIHTEYARGITLMDISGRTVYESQLVDVENTLDIKDLPPGIYFLKTKDGTYKILKE